MDILIQTLLISLGIQLSFFFFAASFKSDKVTDLSYGLTFIIMSWILVLQNPNPSVVQKQITLLITIWGIRLATYLFIRILKIKKDKRFDGIREDFIKFASFWLFQGISVWIIMLPAIFVLSSTKAFPITNLTYFGSLIWLTGLVLETLADYQKYVFKSDPKNKDIFINSGVWKYSRHPNYFGEMLCWWGIFVIALPYLSGLSYLTIIGPLFITYILLFVSGIPPLEKRYAKKFADNHQYKKYKENTSLLIPLPPKS